MLLGLGQGDKVNRKRLPKNIWGTLGQMQINRCLVTVVVDLLLTLVIFNDLGINEFNELKSNLKVFCNYLMYWVFSVVL